jgi:alpha-1,2-mannosyltransferase
MVANVGVQRLRMVQVALAGYALGVLVSVSLSRAAYWKDIQQPYLAAAALRDGIDVFTPLNELSARYFPIATQNLVHPSPYPPFVAGLALPLTLLPFRVVVPLWLVLNVALLVVVGRWLGISVPGTLALAAWPPLWYLLLIGQLELVILVLAMLGWRAARAGRDWAAGSWLGLAAAVKLYPLLLLVPFVARRRGRVLLAAGAVLALGQVGNLLLVGTEGLIHYYRDVLPAVSARYVGLELNVAPYGALLRLFGGLPDATPMVHAPAIVLPLAALLSAAALLALAWLEPEAGPPALVIALPAAWYWYPVLALPAIAALLRSRLRRATIAALVPCSLVFPLVNWMLERLVINYPAWRGPPAQSLDAVLSAIQPAGLVALLLLTVALARADGVGLTGAAARPRLPP